MEETLKLILDKLNNMDSNMKDIKKDVMKLEKHIVVIENEHGAKLDSVMDGYKQLYEVQQEIKNDIKDIKETINVHEVKLLKVK